MTAAIRNPKNLAYDIANLSAYVEFTLIIRAIIEMRSLWNNI